MQATLQPRCACGARGERLRAPAAARCSAASAPALVPLFRALLLQLGTARGAKDASSAAVSLEVGPARRVLKAASADADASACPSPPPRLLAALGCAAAQLLARDPCPLPWVGSPEPGDGVASAARRLVDRHVWDVAEPPARQLDATLLLLALALAEQEGGLEGDALAVACACAQCMLGDEGAAAAAEAAVVRFLSSAPERSEAAARADEQAAFAALAAKQAVATAANVRAAESRRMQRGDWKCAFCAAMNFSDRRVCYVCLLPPEEKEPTGGAPAAAGGKQLIPGPPKKPLSEGAVARKEKERKATATAAAAKERLRLKGVKEEAASGPPRSPFRK